MRKKRKLRKAWVGMLAGVLGASSLLPMISVSASQTVKSAGAAGEISVDPEIHYQTLKGWGTSLCWWGNIIGSWGDEDFNGNGRPDREEIAELAFSPEYLNLNIVRYNVGGGDQENTSIKRREGLVPGWTEDMTGTKDGTGNYNEEAFLAKDTENMADDGQLWMLEQANAYREAEGDIINEVFSNSPPYYMTESGSSTGGWNAEPNLKEDYYDDFAVYMARAAKWIDNDLNKKYGTGVDYVEPMNEPDTSYWGYGSTKQEGCVFKPGEQQSGMLTEMRNALNAEGLDDVQITATDETSLWNAINSFNQLTTAVKEDMTTISAHTYSGSDSERKELSALAKSYDKDLWMSEITRGGGSHDDDSHESMGDVNTQSQSEGIMADLKYMQSSAWIAWLVADSEYECLQTNSSWGLLHAVFESDGPVADYHTKLVDGSGNAYNWIPEEGYWAVTKQFYTMMQYSKYLKAGYTMIDIDDDNMCAAIAPDGSELVIVAQNFGSDRTTTVDLGKFSGAAKAEVYRTSDTKSCELVATQNVTDKVLDVTLPSYSVTTFVITPNDGETIGNLDNYSEIVAADVVNPDDADWTSDVNKFTYAGSWGESGAADGKYTTKADASVTFTFEGTQAAIYGTKGGDETGKVKVSVDGGEAQEVDLTGGSKNVDELLYYTGELENKKHTVTITDVSGLLEVNYAKVITGEFIEEITEIESCADVYTVSGVKPVLPETVTVKTNKEKTFEETVTWNLEGMDFTKDVTLKGMIAGTDKEASVNVKVVEENIAYFIDCNSPKSPAYEEINSYADLLNETADQKYTEGSWGYLDEYGKYDGSAEDKYDTGWWAESGQTIQYTVPLEKGTYEVSFGFKEWWKDSNYSRPMEISMIQGEETTQLGTSNTWKGNNWWNTDTYEIECASDGDVTFSVVKNGDSDPVLSFIQIQKKLDLSALKDALSAAQQVNRDRYSAKRLELLDDAVAAGQPLLYKASVTQAEVDDAAKAITDAMDALGQSAATELTKDAIAANDYVLYTVNCGTPDASVLPNPDSERMGLFQSKFDQAFGVDKEAGMAWGYNAANDYSSVKKSAENATDIGESFIYMSDGDEVTFDKYKSSLGYSFQVPETDETIEGIEPNTYEVTVAFKLPNWDERVVNICLEGQTVATDISLGQYEWVAKTFTTTVTDGELNVDVKAPRRTSSKGDPILNYIKIRAVEDTDPVVEAYDSITGADGAPMYDTNGNQIQAHGGQIQQFTVDGETKWYWIGEDKTYDYRPVGGIHVYSSTDLYNWDDEGVVLQTMEDPDQFETDEYFKNLYGRETEEQKAAIFEDLDRNNTVMERPKMLYNDKTGKYVIWFHCDGRTANSDADYGKAKAGVAVSDSPTGPFKFLGSYKLNYDEESGNYGYDGWDGRGSVRDMNLFKDDDGTAYIIYSSEGNETTYISKLNEDYTYLSADPDKAVYGEDYTRNFVKWSREAPAPFKYKDKYYIINSGCTGWSPNQAKYFVADNIMGPYTEKGDPCTDWGSGTTYDTQSTCVIPVDPENGKYIYMGDHWNSGDLSESRYVWLPIEFLPDDKIAIGRYSDWTLDELEGKGLFEIKSDLPKTAASVDEIAELLPNEVEISYGTETEKTPVTWEVGSYDAGQVGTVTITGTLTEKDNRTFTHEIHVIDSKTVYFFDSGAETSEYFDAAKAELGEQLLNNKADQAYTAENKAGYVAEKVREDSESDYDIGLHAGDGMLQNGWYAGSNKNIEYSFDLEPGKYTVAAGFQEWWSEWTSSRAMKITVFMNGENLGEKEVSLTNSSTETQASQEFTVNEAGTVTVSISKTESADPVLSWISIRKDSDLEIEIADKAALNEKIAEVKAFAPKGYTAESYASYEESVKEALEAAEAVSANEEAKQEEVDDALKALNTAFAAAQEKLVTLDEVIEKALTDNLVPEASKDNYTEESWDAYIAARTTLEELKGEDEITEEQVTDAVKALEQAKAGLAEKPEITVNKEALKAAIGGAEKLEANSGQYTEESWKAVEEALENAREIDADDTVSQKEADDAAVTLNAAVEALVKIADAMDKYKIVTDATDDSYQLNSGETMVIRCTGELKYFVSVDMDGVTVDAADYTVEEGSTIITFSSEYLDTLVKGEHIVSLNFRFEDKEVSVDTTLTVLENDVDEPDTPDKPDTPDTPDKPDESDTPDTTDIPDTPDTPGKSDSGKPGQNDSLNNGTGNSNFTNNSSSADNANSSKTHAVKTGDTDLAGVYVGIIAAAAVAILAVVRRKRIR